MNRLLREGFEISRVLCVCATVLIGSISVEIDAAHAQSRTTKAHAQKLYQEAETDYAAGRLKDARKKMQAAYKLVPSPKLAYNVGRLCERMSEVDCSVKYYRLYLKKGEPSPSERAALEAKIEELVSLKKRQKQQVYTVAPTGDALTREGRVFFERGVQMFKRRQYQAALQAFTAAMRFAPLPEMYYNLGVTAERLGQKRDAALYFREYLRLKPKSPDRQTVKARVAKLEGH